MLFDIKQLNLTLDSFSLFLMTDYIIIIINIGGGMMRIYNVI